MTLPVLCSFLSFSLFSFPLFSFCFFYASFLLLFLFFHFFCSVLPSLLYATPVHACLCACSCSHVHLSTCQNTCMCVYLYVYICMCVYYVCMYICIYVWTVCVCICVYVYVHMGMYMCVYVYICICIYVYICVCVCVYVCIGIYTYTKFFIRFAVQYLLTFHSTLPYYNSVCWCWTTNRNVYSELTQEDVLLFSQNTFLYLYICILNLPQLRLLQVVTFFTLLIIYHMNVVMT